MAKVSVIIPGRCEQYFQRTIDSVLEAATGDVEVVAVVDGYVPDPPLQATDGRVRIIQLDESIGQRAAYNLGVRESSGKYVMKLDAHAMVSPGFDEVLQSHCPEDAVVLPEMRRLDPRKWIIKPRGKTRFMFFGLDLYCHFWNDYRKREAAKVEYPEVMTGQGSCWFTTRTWNDHIGLLNEDAGSWGNVGIEISLRTWLCGGTQIVNPAAWQAHWFRRDDGGFTYPMTGRDVARAHKYTWDNYYFKDDAFAHQTRPFRWLIDKFAPIPGWEAYLVDSYESPRVIVYYTDSQLEERLAKAVRKQIGRAAGPIPIISVSQKPLKFGQNVCVGEKPLEYRSMYEQLLVGLEAAPPESIVYLCEHDVFYHPSHFAKLPASRDHAYFNTNRFYWQVGTDIFFPGRGKRAMSQGVAFREVWLRHVRERLQAWKDGPTHMKIRYYNFDTARPNVDVRHGNNLTPDGKYKMDFVKGRRAGISNLPGWGRVPHFRSKVGYKDLTPSANGDAAAYLRKKFGRRMPQPSPIRCPGFKRKHLPEVFAALGYCKGAEIGVREGRYSEALCRGINGLELLCVDLWGAYYHFDAAGGAAHYATASRRLEPYRATLVKKQSMAAANNVPDASLDFVYIDADHRFDFVMEDLIEWTKKVRPGGIVSGHDYYRFRNAGVVPAVDTYTHVHGIHEWFITDEKEASFFWVKT